MAPGGPPENQLASVCDIILAMRSDISLADLTVVEATLEQWRETQVHGHASWGSGLSIPEYQRREEEPCRLSDFGKRGNHTGWVLVPSDDPTTLVNIASSCETFERPIFIKDADCPEGRRDFCTTICSVYTPVQNRGRGYAQRLLTLLHNKLSRRGILSVLYSDVGHFYSRIKRENADPAIASGWEIVGPYNITLPVSEARSEVPRTGPSTFRTLDEPALAEICKQDASMLQKEVIASPSQIAFSILPSKDQIDWQIARCKFLDTFRHPKSRYEYPFIDDWGCQFGRPGDPDWAFAIWSYDIQENNLMMLRLRCNTPEQLKEVIKLAQIAASKQGMTSITAWNVAEGLLQGTPWSSFERKEHLPAMAWYGEGSPPQWICNENWAWA